MKNPSKLDPTRTGLIRRAFIAEMRRRIKKLLKAINEFLVIQDALALEPRYPLQVLAEKELTVKNELISNVLKREYEFLTNPQKLAAFKRWLRQQIDAEILSTVDWQGKPWLAKYIESAYKKGAIRAYTDVHAESLAKTPDWYLGSREQFLRQSFMQPERLSKIQLIYTRAYNSLDGFTKVMDTQLSRILADGLAFGKGPRQIASEIRKGVSSMTKQRALMIARTEIINAHAEGQLDSMEDLGIEEVGAEVEWSTAGDEIVCSQCAELEGKTFTIEEARGMIPYHPNCRCAWMPYISEDKKKLLKKSY